MRADGRQKHIDGPYAEIDGEQSQEYDPWGSMQKGCREGVDLGREPTPGKDRDDFDDGKLVSTSSTMGLPLDP